MNISLWGGATMFHLVFFVTQGTVNHSQLLATGGNNAA
jgi:hypothetical protein